jgi:four helix bundle protein
MSRLKSYRDLVAWQKAMALTKHIYEISVMWPDREMFGLTAQIRRAAVSIPSNIAEGQGRNTTRDFMRHLSIAYGSLLEVETQAQIATDLGFIDNDNLSETYSLTEELGRVINGLLRSLRSKHDPR